MRGKVFHTSHRLKKEYNKFNMLNKFQKSFTLIELLVVIAIIGLIAAIIMVGVSGTQAKARDAKRQVELDQVRKALEFYYTSEGKYPTTSDWISLEGDDESNGPFSQAMKPSYLSIIPKDPLYPQDGSGQKYSYWYQATTPESYELYAKREQGGFFEVSSELGTIAYLSEGPGGRIGKFWVGGTGNWSDTNHWSDSWGGPPGATKPTSSDNVYFDINSGGGTVTVNEIANSKDLDFTGYTGTFAGSSALNIYGSLTMASGMARTYTGAITFAATSAGKTLTFNGKTMASATTFNGVGGGWIVQDTWNNGTNNITLTNGNLNTNGQTITCGTFASSNSNTRSLTLGSSSITCSTAGTAWNLATVTGLTFNAGTSQITLTGSSATFSGGAQTYNNVILNSAGTVTISGANTFANLTRIGTAVTTNWLSLGANQTTTGTLTLSGNSVTNRLLVLSSTVGTARTLTAAAVSLTNVDFQYISGAGVAAPFSGTSLGNSLGDSNINFTAAVTRYWVGNGGSWNSTTKWSASSGGASGASVPLPHDTVVFDANSITSTGQTITVNMPRLGTNIDFSAVANNPTLSFGTTANTIYGSLTLGSNMTISGTQGLTFFSVSSTFNLTSNGRTFTNAVTINVPGGTFTLQDTFNSNSSITFNIGTFNANNQNITATIFSSSNSNTRTVTMGSGTWTLTGTGTVWNTAAVTGLTLNANTSSVVINNNSATGKIFAGGGRTFYNFRFTNTGTGTTTISGSNVFNNFTVDTQPKIVSFTVGTTQTINGVFTSNGSAGALMTFRSTASPTKWTVSASSTSLSYVDVQDSTGSGAAAPFACGATCVNSGNNTGWTF